MIPSSTDTPVFVTRRPSWEHGVELAMQHETTVFMSRSGIEERQQRRTRAKCDLRYRAVLTPAETAARDATGITQMNATQVVPFWSERALTTTAIAANVVSIDRAPDADWFVAGDHVYLHSTALGGQFREIASVAGSALTLVADGGAFAYLTGATIYPCRRCLRTKGIEWEQDSATTGIEDLTFQTL